MRKSRSRHENQIHFNNLIKFENYNTDVPYLLLSNIYIYIPFEPFAGYNKKLAVPSLQVPFFLSNY